MRWLWLLLPGLAAATAALAPAASALGCGSSSGYSYAGLVSTDRVYGVGASLTALSPVAVQSGHVAGWVGVGGPKEGPAGIDEWLQVGLSGFPGRSSSNLYYEVQLPAEPPRYVELERAVAPGVSRRVAVLEVAGRPDWWRVWVNGRPASAPVELPGSHGAWRAVATAESWSGADGGCNSFGFDFAQIVVARQAGGDWSALAGSTSILDKGLRLTRQELSGFVASAAAG